MDDTSGIKGFDINEVPQELLSYIKTGSKFIIIGHKEPDGDCVGSQLALRSALLRLKKEVIVCSTGPFKRTELKDYTTYFLSSLNETEKSDARLIIVDCTGKDRIGDLQDSIKDLPLAIIDHHSSATHPNSTNEAPVYIDANSPSCTLLIEKLITSLGLELTADEATWLLFGLCTDTGFFRHLTEKNAAVFEAIARMVRAGANPKQAYNIMNGGKTLSSRILLGKVLSRTEEHFNGKLMYSYETLEEFKKYGFEARDSDALNKMLLSIEGVEAVMVIRQECEETCSVSLRSIDKIDVSKIAVSFGGGGHKNASGLTMQGSISYIKEKILETFSGYFI